MQEVFVDYINYIGGLKNYSRNTISAYEKNLSMFETWLQKNDADIFKLTANDVRVFILSPRVLSLHVDAMNDINFVIALMLRAYIFASLKYLRVPKVLAPF